MRHLNVSRRVLVVVKNKERWAKHSLLCSGEPPAQESFPLSALLMFSHNKKLVGLLQVILSRSQS